MSWKQHGNATEIQSNRNTNITGELKEDEGKLVRVMLVFSLKNKAVTS